MSRGEGGNFSGATLNLGGMDFFEIRNLWAGHGQKYE